MADAAHAWTDDEVAQMEARLMRMYRRAEREMIATWREYMEKYARDIEGAQREYDALKNGGDAEAIRKKGRELAQLKREKLMTGQHWRNMLMQVAERYAGVNAEAVAYINGKLPEIFLHNYNAAQHQIAADAPGYSFELADRDTVAFLTMYEDAQLLPEAAINRSADISWNRRRVNGEMLQGILQGDSIPRLAKRLAGVTGANAAASIRWARTATTGAENRGRIESYKRAEAMGVKLEQEWMATLDGRTRHSHRQMHGKRVKVGEKFDNGCRWPGDPDAPGVEIYNCRCCLVAAVEGADNELVTDSKKLDTDFETWRAGGSGAKDAEAEQGAAAQVPTLRWTREEYEAAKADRDRVLQEEKDAAVQWYESECDRLIDSFGGGFVSQRVAVKRDDTLSPGEKEAKLAEIEAKREEYKKQKDILAAERDRRWEAAYDKWFSTYAPEYEYGRIEGIYTTRDNASAVNPNWHYNDFMYTHNCQRCCVAFELRERGYDAEACGAPPEGGLGAEAQIRASFAGAEEFTHRGYGHENTMVVREKMLEWGNGSRAIAIIGRDGGVAGHAFNVEVINGHFTIIDSQLGAMWDDAEKGDAIDGGAFEEEGTYTLTLYRVDNVPVLLFPDGWIKRRGT